MNLCSFNINSPYRKGYIQILTLSVLISFCMVSCKKFVEVPSPVNQIITSTVFTADATAVSAVTGLYAQVMNGNMTLLNGAMSLYPGLTSDEIYNTNPNSVGQPFWENAILSSNSTNANLWSRGYSFIYQINAMIQGLTNSSKLTTATKNQLLGESYFMRALCYFYLTNLYGDIPLELTTDYKINGKKPQTPEANVYNQIILDLEDAKSLLSKDYVTSYRARPNKWAAIALLARVELYRRQWVRADSAANAVISSGAYLLEDNLNSVFLKGSKETIWQLMPLPSGFNTAEGFTFIPSSPDIIPRYAITPYLLKAFEVGDKRKKVWLDSNIINSQVFYFPYKYKVYFNMNIQECNIVLRLAEQYLIRAEARVYEGNLSGAQADLNVIRHRAGLNNISANDKTSLLSAIAKERRLELFCEWGHRWFDLKRTNELNAIMASEKLDWKPTDSLYPIPESEIESNPALIQNKGY